MIDSRTIIVSFSGGRSSAYMCWLLETMPEYQEREKIYVFANTGRELTETIVFVRNVMRYVIEKPIFLLEAKVIHNDRKSSKYTIIPDFHELAMEGEPYEEVIEKYGLPSVATPHCTRELKVNPIKNFIKDHLGLKKGEYVEAIGYRFDELKRAKNSPDYIYPLIDQKVKKDDVSDFWINGDFKKWDLGLEDFEGNCDFCFKKSWDKLKKMAKKRPNRLLWWNNMEEKHWEDGHQIFRGHKVALDLYNEVDYEDEDISCACSHHEDSEF